MVAGKDKDGFPSDRGWLRKETTFSRGEMVGTRSICAVRGGFRFKMKQRWIVEGKNPRRRMRARCGVHLAEGAHLRMQALWLELSRVNFSLWSCYCARTGRRHGGDSGNVVNQSLINRHKLTTLDGRGRIHMSVAANSTTKSVLSTKFGSWRLSPATK